MTAFEIAQYLVVGLGCICVFCSTTLGVYYVRSHRRVGRSIAFVFFAEAIGLAITVAFSLGRGVFHTFDERGDMLLRVIMFTTALLSSVHMGVSIDRILRRTHEPSERHN